jgi:cytochrome c oxidase assembly protein subunit 15
MSRPGVADGPRAGAVRKASPPVPRWLHRWSVGTACATFVLLALGAVVTTFQVGMADPIWPTYPWHLLLVSWEEPRPGFLIEHTHRLAGYVVGCCVIVLAVGLWRQGGRGLRWLGVASLGGVIVQGLLGGFRVRLNEWFGPNLALVHGSFAAVVFSLLVSLAVLTAPGAPGMSREWTREPDGRLRGLSVLAAGLVFLQIILGGLLRHTYSPLGQRGHLLVAFAVVAAVAWLAREVAIYPVRQAGLAAPTAILAALVVLQLALGVEAWMQKYFLASAPLVQASVRTTHVLTGHLTLAAAVTVALQVHRRVATATAPEREAVA